MQIRVPRKRNKLRRYDQLLKIKFLGKLLYELNFFLFINVTKTCLLIKILYFKSFFSILNVIFLKDVDECIEQLDNCNHKATCLNNHGSFSCQCMEGYYGDGFDCHGSFDMLNLFYCWNKHMTVITYYSILNKISSFLLRHQSNICQWFRKFYFVTFKLKPKQIFKKKCQRYVFITK